MTKNLVLLQFHSNSDLHTFQKILRKRKNDSLKKDLEKKNVEIFVSKIVQGYFFYYNVLKRMEKISSKSEQKM